MPEAWNTAFDAIGLVDTISDVTVAPVSVRGV